MKILQLVTRRQYRGAEVFAANLSAELLKLGHSIYFVGLYKNHENVLSVRGAVNKDLVEVKNGPLSVGLIKQIVKLIGEVRPDVIQCNGSDTLKYMVAASFFLPKTPILYRNISMISEWVSSGPKKLVYKRLFKRISHVSSVGEEAIADFIKTFDYPKARTSVIRRGIPLKDIERQEAAGNLKNELDLDGEAVIAMHVGNFSPEKNHAFLIEVFASLKTDHPHIKLVCVGSGMLLEETQRLVAEKALNNNVFFLGFRKNISELLAGADFFVLSSTVEGVPGVILEAATQKIPAIATNVGGVREVLEDHKTGFIVDGFDQSEFKNRILQLAKDNVLRSEMGSNAYHQVVENFNPVRNARKFEELYTTLIQNQ
jgi:glycosyltransferase involved in cell wall biosynthesis